MEAAGPRGKNFRSAIAIHIRRITAVMLAGLLAGCLRPEPQRLNPAPPLSLADLKQLVSELRALPFKQEMSQTAPPPSSRPEDGDDFGAPPLTQIGRAYKRLGLLAESVDFPKVMIEFARMRQLAVYDAGRDRLALAPEAARLGEALAGERGGEADQTAAVLALARALQDQHFRWSEKLKGPGLDDRKLAFRALGEGDTLLVALSYLSKTHGPLNWGQATLRFATEMERVGGRLPELLKQELVFPYRDGSQFVQWAFLAKGWSGVNTLFADPPVASAQILHPEKYFLRRQAPLRITPFGLKRKFQGSAVVDDSLGEYRIQLLLGANQPRNEAERIASAWSGDHLSAYPDGESLVTAWISAWSGAKEAREFLSAFRTALERRHRVRFDEARGAPDGWKAELRTGRSMVLQVRGAALLFLDGVATTRALEVGEDTWKELEIVPEPADFSFDLAKRPAQLSRSSR